MYTNIDDYINDKKVLLDLKKSAEDQVEKINDTLEAIKENVKNEERCCFEMAELAERLNQYYATINNIDNLTDIVESEKSCLKDKKSEQLHFDFDDGVIVDYSDEIID